MLNSDSSQNLIFSSVFKNVTLSLQFMLFPPFLPWRDVAKQCTMRDNIIFTTCRSNRRIWIINYQSDKVISFRVICHKVFYLLNNRKQRFTKRRCCIKWTIFRAINPALPIIIIFAGLTHWDSISSQKKKDIYNTMFFLFYSHSCPTWDWCKI